VTGVTFVVPVCNAGVHLPAVLESVIAQADGRPMEILAVEDGSRDGSADVLRTFEARRQLRIVTGPRAGAAAAVNAGVAIASHPIVCQIDQDVVLDPAWLSRLLPAFDDPRVAAAQGCYETDPAASFFARVMSLDLEYRYSRLHTRPGHRPPTRIDHVCTGNTAYRVAALRAIDGLDETLGYGYDNDLSYRLLHAGYRLVICRDARSRHRWREGLGGYLRQQYGFGYGRLDVVARHPRRWTGDAVSPAGMMMHPVLTALAALCVATGGMLAARGGAAGTAWMVTGLLILGGLAVERTWAGIRAWQEFGDAAALAFAPIHAARDLAWVTAAGVWCARRMLRRRGAPAHSMRARSAA